MKISLHEQRKIELRMSRKGMQKRALSLCSFIKGIPSNIKQAAIEKEKASAFNLH